MARPQLALVRPKAVAQAQPTSTFAGALRRRLSLVRSRAEEQRTDALGPATGVLAGLLFGLALWLALLIPLYLYLR